MKTKALITVVAMLLAILALALPAPVQATAPEALQIHVAMTMTGSASAAGTFWTEGLITDSGTDFGDASETFFIDEDTIRGVKTLIGEHGTIVLKFQAQLTWTATGGIANGRFTILSGTGDYKKLHGQGTTVAILGLTAIPPVLTAVYDGQAHFD
jgi:hypothetical protein